MNSTTGMLLGVAGILLLQSGILCLFSLREELIGFGIAITGTGGVCLYLCNEEMKK